MNIRLENINDWFEVENLTREAFWNVYQPGCTEHLIVHNLRSHPALVSDLSLVIEDDSKRIIAHIIYCKATILSDSGEKIEILMFGPVSVLPEFQHRGFGRKIIEYSLQKSKELGYGAVAITGNPKYYRRFGFKSGSEFQIYYANLPRTEEAPFFMIKELVEGFLDETVGKIIELDDYTVSDEAVEEFDLKFSPKIKEKRPGQLV
ncbi:GNAT family N-acetyltransferase [Alkalibaculum sp. M08DMB]|uniref:GNAT family N-acetyltransferase n=2 Tax=Alkalibaculum sporogenes TaxID=2655001 RepID=A0A6A7K709_9FIRM|nr:GNAT family N-acetyltransferase [Alkalibaculum sporogenes]